MELYWPIQDYTGLYRTIWNNIILYRTIKDLDHVSFVPKVLFWISTMHVPSHPPTAECRILYRTHENEDWVVNIQILFGMK